MFLLRTEEFDKYGIVHEMRHFWVTVTIRRIRGFVSSFAFLTLYLYFFGKLNCLPCLERWLIFPPVEGAEFGSLYTPDP